MADAGALFKVLKVLQYLTPVLTLVYFLGSTTVSVVRLQTLDKDVSPRLRRTVSGFLLASGALYIAQSGLIIDLLFKKPGLYGSESANIHALSYILVWLIISTSLLNFENCTWYPYYGSWILCLAFEVVILALSLSLGAPSHKAEHGLVIVQAVRIALLTLLSAVFFSLRGSNSKERGDDEERVPILGTSNQDEDAATGQANARVNGNAQADVGKAKQDSTDGDGENSDSDDDEDSWVKEEKKKTEQMKKRLKEGGGWYAYLKGFSVFLPYIWPARSFRLKLHLFGVVLCMLLQRVVNPLEPAVLGLVVDSLSSGDPGKAFSTLGLYIGLNAVSSNIHVVRDWLWLPVEINTTSRMEKASYNHIMELSCDFHDSKRTGEVFEAMSQGQSVVDLIETLGFTLVPELADLAIAAFYFYWLFGSYMTLLGITTGVVYIVVSIAFTGKSGGLRRQMNTVRRQKSQVKYDTVGGWKTVSYFNRVPHSQKRYGEVTDVANNLSFSYQIFLKIMYSVQSVVIDVGLFAACVLAVYKVMYEGIPVGRFVTLMNYWYYLTGPLITLSHTSKSLLFDLIDAESLLRIWNTTSSVRDGDGELALTEGHVRFEDVSFKYDTSKDTIEGLTFEAKPGQTIALVGETGAGKSTILKLLFRFYDPTAGRIVIDGQEIREVSLQSLRENIGVVPQDPTLFNVSIMENIRYAKLDATDEEIFEACRAAAVHDKILTFAKGYKSKVGERGVKLSGGELQRVAIARAILKNPPIVLLDEATSSVDSETEAKIQVGLKRLCLNRTTFVVAHRLSTIQHADQIMVIKEGKIVEQGTPANLLEQKGKYYNLWTRQMGLFDPFAPKKEKKDGDISDNTTQGGDDEDLIDLQAKDDTVDSEVIANTNARKELRVETDGLTKDDATNPEPCSASKSPSKSTFRPDAPEFVPRSNDSEPQREAQTEATQGSDDKGSVLNTGSRGYGTMGGVSSGIDSAPEGMQGASSRQTTSRPARSRSRAQSRSDSDIPPSGNAG